MKQTDNQPERYAIFLPSLIVGGAERSMLKLAAGIAERGYPVDLVLGRRIGELTGEISPKIHVVDLGANRMIRCLPPLIRYLRQTRPAAMLAVLHANLFAVWAKLLSGAPTRVIISERNTTSEEIDHYASDLRMRLLPGLIRLFYPMADQMVTVSEGVADDLAKLARVPRGRVRAIYNPIITPELRRMTQAELDHPWFFPGQPPVILAVGRLSEQKDFSTLIKAFALLRQSRSARLMILGDGEERQPLEALVEALNLKEDVSLPGFIANPYPFMEQAACFVLSSRWEGLPGVLIEALYCGAPIVSTQCPHGPDEILAGGAYGQLVRVGDPSEMASAISRVLESPPPANPPESWQPFEMNHVVDQYLEVLHG